MKRTHATSAGGMARLATGTYTGNGAATQAIVGVGFRPRWLYIFSRTGQTLGFKVTEDGVNCLWANIPWGNWGGVNNDMIISLDADGFTVGDGTGSINCFNSAGWQYTYVALG